MEQLVHHRKKKNARRPRWSLPENSMSAWIAQQSSNPLSGQQRLLEQARQKLCMREGFGKLQGDKTHIHRSPSLRKPRHLSPLAVKPSAVLRSRERTIHQLQESELKLTVPAGRKRAGAHASLSPKSPLLAVPLQPVASTISSTGSSSSSSPLPSDTYSSAASLSARSRDSVFSTLDQSPPTNRRGRLSPLKPTSGSKNSLFYPSSQRTPSPHYGGGGHYQQQLCPYLTSVSPICPQPRPSNPTGKRSPYAVKKCRQAKKPILAPEENEPKAAMPQQAKPATSSVEVQALVQVIPPENKQQSDNLNIPEITIRFATPVPSDNNQCSLVIPIIAVQAPTPAPPPLLQEEDSSNSLYDKFILREDLLKELETLTSDQPANGCQQLMTAMDS